MLSMILIHLFLAIKNKIDFKTFVDLNRIKTMKTIIWFSGGFDLPLW